MPEVFVPQAAKALGTLATGLAANRKFEAEKKFAERESQFKREKANMEKEQKVKAQHLKALNDEFAINEKLLQDKGFAEEFPNDFDALVDRQNIISTEIRPGSLNLFGKAIRANFSKWQKANKTADNIEKEAGKGSPQHIKFLQSAIPEFEEPIKQEFFKGELEEAKEFNLRKATAELFKGEEAVAVGKGVPVADVKTSRAAAGKPTFKLFKSKNKLEFLDITKEIPAGFKPFIKPAAGKPFKQGQTLLFKTPEGGGPPEVMGLSSIDGVVNIKKMNDLLQKGFKTQAMIKAENPSFAEELGAILGQSLDTEDEPVSSSEQALADGKKQGRDEVRKEKAKLKKDFDILRANPNNKGISDKRLMDGLTGK